MLSDLWDMQFSYISHEKYIYVFRKKEKLYSQEYIQAILEHKQV